MPRSHEKGDRPTFRNISNNFEVLALAAIVKARYTASGLNCSDFAKTVNDTASEIVDFRFPLNAGHIRSILNACKIPLNRVPAAEKTTALSRRMMLEARVNVLETRIKQIEQSIYGGLHRT